MQIHGSNFPANNTVEITVDDNHIAFRSTIVSASVGRPGLWERQIRPSDHTVTVKSDGTFDTTIAVPLTWSPGSHHTIRAATQNVQASTQASIDVVVIQPLAPTATVSPTGTPTPPATPTPTPSATPTPTPPPPQPPVVSGLDQTSGPAAGGTTVTISGTGFTDATGVSFGSTAATSFKVVGDKKITAVSPAGSGMVDVRVTTSNGTSQTSSADQFTYTAPPPPPQSPVVTGLNPMSGPVSGRTQVTITGSGFTRATSVAFGSATIQCSGDSSCTVNSDGTQIIVTSPAESSSDSSGKPVDVRVTTPNGTSQTSSADRFTYTVPLPVVSKISPKSKVVKGGDTVTITGTGFKGATTVAFGKATVSCNADPDSNCIVTDDTQITVIIPVGSGTVDVTVTTPAGTSKTSKADQFTYIPPPPIVSSVDPSSGPTAGGKTVTIIGSGFTGATKVAFGKATVTCITAYSANPFAGWYSTQIGFNAGFKHFYNHLYKPGQSNHVQCTVDSDTQITIVNSPPQDPSDTSNPVDVTVITPNGTSQTSSADQFTYLVG